MTNINCILYLLIVTLAVSVVNIIVHGKVELQCPARPEQIPDLTEFTNIYVSLLSKRIFSAENRMIRQTWSSVNNIHFTLCYFVSS